MRHERDRQGEIGQPDLPDGDPCEFCQEIGTGNLPIKYRRDTGIDHRMAGATEHTCAVPSLSPISAFHLLLLPRRHVTSSFQLPAAERADVERCLALMAGRLGPAAGTRLVVFEHGIGRARSGGCGIAHCHLHLIPLPLDSSAAIWSTFSSDPRARESAGAGPRAAEEEEESYVLLQIRDRGGMIMDERINWGEFPSQYLRNLIERVLGLAESNWRELVRPEVLDRTVELLRKGVVEDGGLTDQAAPSVRRGARSPVR